MIQSPVSCTIYVNKLKLRGAVELYVLLLTLHMNQVQNLYQHTNCNTFNLYTALMMHPIVHTMRSIFSHNLN